VTPDTEGQPGGLSPAGGSGPRKLLRYRSAQGRRVVAAMILGSSVAGIDSTVVAVALPAIGRNLHAGFQGLQWTVTSYTLTLASLILLAGSLSDRWGRRRVFLAGLGWFALASVLCAGRRRRHLGPARPRGARRDHPGRRLPAPGRPQQRPDRARRLQGSRGHWNPARLVRVGRVAQRHAGRVPPRGCLRRLAHRQARGNPAQRHPLRPVHARRDPPDRPAHCLTKLRPR
jgi:hypothetical protein